MAEPADVLRKLQDYVRKAKDVESSAPSPGDSSAYAARLEITFKELSLQAEEERNAIEQVTNNVPASGHSQLTFPQLKANFGDSSINEPSTDPKTRLEQLQVIKAAYTSLTQAAPNLPSPDSPLPALLALRGIHKALTESKDSALIIHQKLSEARKRLAQEQADLRDAQLITIALQDRIARLTIEVQEKSQKSPEEAARTLIDSQEERRQYLEAETLKLVKALARFIKSHLAAPLAAEELGGPVVGDLLDVPDEMPAAGFNPRGNARKSKTQTGEVDAKRQSRVNQIWGLHGGAVNEGHERAAAATEMRLLVEDLLNVAAEEGAGAYVTLKRDSAAARFLIRTKVAQFHPGDARRLRLIDFGRELDE
ncbi:hypothetical protein MMC34_007019 [Xylographa carneopallida]|nr:hypothetical protein [Xylographa carneopallida]